MIMAAQVWRRKGAWVWQSRPVGEPDQFFACADCHTRIFFFLLSHGVRSHAWPFPLA